MCSRSSSIQPIRTSCLRARARGSTRAWTRGGMFKGGVTVNKGQGIPATARRTRKLKLDPAQPDTVYAGTTQGLYKSTDGGTTWVRMTGADVIVNDVYVDPNQPQHVLLATDRGGVLRSEDSGMTFQASNDGFTLRQVVAFAADQRDPTPALCRRGERQGGRRRFCEQRRRREMAADEQRAWRPRCLQPDDGAGRYAAGRDVAWRLPDGQRDVDCWLRTWFLRRLLLRRNR